MKNSNFVSTILLFFIAFVAFGQTEQSDQSLRGQFQEMLDGSNTYRSPETNKEFKIINRVTLDAYSRAVQDSIISLRTQTSSLRTEVSDLKSQVSQLTTRITDLESQLDESEELRESLVFLGIPMNKATYHLVVWIIIAGLAVFGIFAYTSFARSNKVTAKTKKEMNALEVEYDEHKKKSHEKQIKMGRELQTERNLVEELKAKLKAKPSPGK